MHETLGDGYVVDGGKRVYADENPGVRDATQFRHEEANSFQEEIANVIRAEGIILNSASETIASMTQLNTAINKKVSNEVIARDAAIAVEAANRAGYDASLQNQISNMRSDLVGNDSSVSGVTVSNALNNLQSAISVNIPRGYIDGFKMVRDVSVVMNMAFHPGICKDKTDTFIIQYTGSAIVKIINSAWVQGTGNGGFGGNDGGPNSDNWYYAFAIYKNGQPVDFGFDNDSTGVNLLAASTYTHCRRIGVVYYTGSGMRRFYQKGDWFLWATEIREVVDLNTGSATEKLGTIKIVPIGIDGDITDIIFGVESPDNNNAGLGAYVYIYPSGTTSHLSFGCNPGSTEYHDAGNELGPQVRSSCTRKIYPLYSTSGFTGYAALKYLSKPTVACSTAYYCYGYRDKRGKDE